MITLEHVALEYTPGTPVLRDVSFELKPGSFHFLTGASGAGKSTLLSLLSMQLRASSGNMFMFGDNVTYLARELLPKYRRRSGIVLQDYRLLDHLTIADNVGLPLKVAGESPQLIQEKVSELLEWIGLKDAY